MRFSISSCYAVSAKMLIHAADAWSYAVPVTHCVRVEIPGGEAMFDHSPVIVPLAPLPHSTSSCFSVETGPRLGEFVQDGTVDLARFLV